MIGGVPVRELVKTTVLEESPHRPGVPVVITAELDAVMSFLPRVCVTDFVHRVPCVHRRRRKGVADPRIALRSEPRRSPRALAAEPHALDAPVAHDVVAAIIL